MRWVCLLCVVIFNELTLLSGLGKTIQVIAFLAHFKIRNPEQKHLIIVP